MASKEEMKYLLSVELKKTAEYQEVLLLKEVLLNEIAQLSTSMIVRYDFQIPINIVNSKTFRLCFQLEFGWIPWDFYPDHIIIDISKFLE